jgi:hypothetical protein
MPRGYEYFEDEAGQKRRSSGLQSWQGVSSPARLLSQRYASQGASRLYSANYRERVSTGKLT